MTIWKSQRKNKMEKRTEEKWQEMVPAREALFEKTP